MKYYAVIDTNVLVSAMLKWNSVPGNVMELAFDGPIIPVCNSDILYQAFSGQNVYCYSERNAGYCIL